MAFDDCGFEITSAISRLAAIPMVKVKGETRLKRANLRCPRVVGVGVNTQYTAGTVLRRVVRLAVDVR